MIKLHLFSRYLLFVMIVVLFSCKGDGSKTTASESKTPEATGTSSGQNTPSLPALTSQKISEFYQQVDYIDYIFYNLDFSMSQSDPAAIQTNISYIGTDAAPIGAADCPKSMGRKFFHSNGEIIMEAEIFLSQQCSYYQFMDGNKPIYANSMTQAGVQFYFNLINQLSGGNTGQ